MTRDRVFGRGGGGRERERAQQLTEKEGQGRVRISDAIFRAEGVLWNIWNNIALGNGWKGLTFGVFSLVNFLRINFTCRSNKNDILASGQSSSHRTYLLIYFRKSTPPRNRQLVCYY